MRFKVSRVHKSSFSWFTEDLTLSTSIFYLCDILPDCCLHGCNPLTEVTVVYQNGLPVISVSLPSRRERCQFTLKPLSDCVGVFLQQLQAEDRGIDRVAIYSTGTFTSTRSTLYICIPLHAVKCSCIWMLSSVAIAAYLHQNLIPLHAPFLK